MATRRNLIVLLGILDQSGPTALGQWLQSVYNRADLMDAEEMALLVEAASFVLRT